MTCNDLEWPVISGLPEPHPATAPPPRPLLPPEVEQEFEALEARQVRLIKAMAWDATGIILLLICGLPSVLSAGLSALRIYLIVLIVGLGGCFLVLQRRYAAASAPQGERQHMQRYRAWKRSHANWLQQARTAYRRSLTPEQRRRLDRALVQSRSGRAPARSSTVDAR